jgi:tetratricopeptide (TPR) repeat protein
VYSDLGEYEKARDLLETALKSAKANFGENHPKVAVRQSNLAKVYSDLGKYEKARDLWKSAYDIFKVSLGSDHPYTKSVAGFIENYNGK